VRSRNPGGVLAAVMALAAICVLSIASPSSGSGSELSLPAVEGPAISSLNGANAQSRGCLFASLGLTCYGPYELGKAYDFPSNLDGRGQTIIIVDAYGSPTIQSDLAAFDTYFDVPAPPSFKIITARGTGATGSGDTADWGVETSLDVEYAHAMAPGANIVLAVAATDNNNDLNAAEAQVFPFYPHAIISQSFGDWETDPTAGNSYEIEHKIFEVATALGDTILASAGDAGATWTQYTGTTSPAIASYPASDPLVTGVGGTQGLPYPGGLYANGGYGGEQVWNEPQFDAATGGAPSILFQAPSWQQGLTGYRMRTIPDVSYNAAVNGGELVVFDGELGNFGGTSVGSPHWAAIFADADQERAQFGQSPIGQGNPALYSIASNWREYQNDFHDITIGNNEVGSSIGYSAGPGYDIPTGLGTPDASNLIGDLVSQGFQFRHYEPGFPSFHGGGGNHGAHHFGVG